MSAVITIAVLLSLSPIFAYWRAYVIVTLWTWFVTPAYGYAPPSIYVLTGIVMILSLAMPVKPPSAKDTRGNFERAWDAIGFAALLPATILLGGWIWKWLQWGVA